MDLQVIGRNTDKGLLECVSSIDRKDPSNIGISASILSV